MVMLAEPTVEEAFRLAHHVFLPRQEQGDAFATHLLIDLRPVWGWTQCVG